MTSNRLDELVEDIRINGQRIPIVICEDMVLDGRNRAEACQKLNIEPVTTQFDGDPWAYVWSVNGSRRDLVDEQRYLIWKQCNEKSEQWQSKHQQLVDEANEKRSKTQIGISKADIIKKERRGTECSRTLHPARKAKASASKTNPGAVLRGDKLVKERPDLAEQVRLGKMKPAEAHRQMRKDATETRMKEAAQKYDKNSKTWTVTSEQDIIKCNALITDPPYGILSEDWEPDSNQLEDMTKEWANRWNECEADILLIFFSQKFMWEGRKWFDEFFSNYYFQQMLIWHYPNNKSPQSRQGFKQTWEPIFFYRHNNSTRKILISNTEWGGGLNDFDCHVAAVPQSNFNDAEYKVHPAQKPVSVFSWLINATTEIGELVCDPFAGSGTSGIAACQLERRWHGIEINKEYIELIKQRILSYGRNIS